MTSPQDEPKLEGAHLARKIADEESGLIRVLSGPSRYVVPFVALGWCFFQLSLSSWLLLETTYIRSIHLGFALTIAFLSYPTFRRGFATKGLQWLSARHKIPVIDWLLAIVACISAIYIILDYEGISLRMGSPLLRDKVMGILLLLTLLEAARRVMGPALPIISLVVIFYGLFASYMPEALAFKSISLNRFFGQITLSSEGIYGIPLDVSARIVFYFVLFGAMLERAGAGHYFIELATSLLGAFKGGPAKAAIVGSALTGMISGSSIANVVTCGTFTIPLMKKVGYPAKKAAAIEVAAGIDGQITPPVMGAAAFIIAEYVNMPYLDVCKAAAIPAFVSYSTLFFIVHLEACKMGLKGLPREELPKFWSTFWRGCHFLVPLGVLIYELIIPRHSPELASFRAIVVMTLVMLIQEPVKSYLRKEPLRRGVLESFKLLYSSFVAGGLNMVSVAIATASAGIIIGVVAMGPGGLITEIIRNVSGGNIYLMLVITMFASIILGMGLPTTATYIVTASLAAPAIVSVAADAGVTIPIMAAHLFCFYFGMLADDTPPVGLATYAASAIAHSPIIPTGIQGFKYHIRTAILPFMFVFNTELILHQVESWYLAIMIFLMACVGNFAFASATQGWFTARNRWYEVPVLLLVTALMMRPSLSASLMGIPHAERYLVYLIGLGLWIAVFLLQKRRSPAPASAY